MRQKCFRTLFSCFRTSFNFQKLFRDNMYLHSNELLNLTVARKKKKFEKIKNLKKKFKKFFEKKIFCVNCHWHKSASIVMYNQSVSNDIFFNLRQMPCTESASNDIYFNLRQMPCTKSASNDIYFNLRQMPCTKSASNDMQKVNCVKSQPALNFCASKGPASKATPYV